MYLPPSAAGDGWYSVNNYIDAKIRISDKYWDVPKDIPFSNQPTSGNVTICNSTPVTQPAATGTHGNMALRISKPFVGTTFIPNMKLASVYSCMANDGQCIPDGNPTMDYYFSGTVTVPQNCIVGAGTQLVVSLGSFFSGDFEVAGQKPQSYTPKTFNVPIQCNDLSATANLTLRLQGTPSADVPNALQSDNPDVGVVVTDGNGNPLVPNDSSSVIPFQLDDSNRANVTLHAYPVGTTGNTPEVGQFTTLAYLRVDFS
jgi:type 1 fimbria pilin